MTKINRIFKTYKNARFGEFIIWEKMFIDFILKLAIVKQQRVVTVPNRSNRNKNKKNDH